MEALTTGFCAAALTQALSPQEAEEWHRTWPQPTLQVVDIQRYPRTPTLHTGPCRFYLAASDGEALVWLVVPPHTPLEEAIAGFELEVGCCVTLLTHTLVTAANGLNVVVPLQLKYSTNTLRLLGKPSCSPTLFSLSPTSLVQRSVEAIAVPSAAAAPHRPSHRVAVRDFVDSPEKALGNWSIAVRVVWRGREYQMHAQNRQFGSSAAATSASAASSSSSSRYVFRCLLVDARGDGIVGAFFGGDALLDRVQLHDTLLLSQGTVKWGVGEAAAPVELQFVEKSIERVLNAAETQSPPFPFYAAALVGAVAQDLRTVAEVVDIVDVGDYTSVVGVVAAVQGSTQITTKRGRVSRAVVTLTGDEAGAEETRGGSGVVEVTLWGDIAESADPQVGERWVFHSCAVQLFQQRKTLSSRQSTMAVQLRPLPVSDEVAKGDGEAVATAAGGKLIAQRQDGAAGVVAEVDSDAVAGSAPHRSMQFVLDLHEASPTLPVLARVQEVHPPLLTWTCTACRATVDALPSGMDHIPERCGACGSAEVSPSCHVAAVVGDGVACARVVLHGSVAENLFQATAMELARCLERDSRACLDVCARLAGAPVLVFLLAEGKNEGDERQYMVASCRHIDYVAGCQTLLSALETFMVDGNGEV